MMSEPSWEMYAWDQEAPNCVKRFLEGKNLYNVNHYVNIINWSQRNHS